MSPVTAVSLVIAAVLLAVVFAPAAGNGVDVVLDTSSAFPTGTPSPPLPTVGALFAINGNSLAGHFCTASVVDSPSRDLVVTAAHCVDGQLTDSQSNADDTSGLAFVPGYHDGQTPYGVWLVTGIVVDPAWSASGDPDHDVAFLTTRQMNGQARLQDVTGAVTLGVDQSPTSFVQVIGYPNNADEPIGCQNRTTAVGVRRMEFDCANFSDGTSGSPFLVGTDTTTGRGTVIGVLGGYEQGGDDPGVSYSATFGPQVWSLYEAAVAKG